MHAWQEPFRINADKERIYQFKLCTKYAKLNEEWAERSTDDEDRECGFERAAKLLRKRQLAFDAMHPITQAEVTAWLLAGNYDNVTDRGKINE